MKKDIKILMKVIIISGAAFFINYLINFFLTPYITKNIGTEAYGYVTLAKTIASYALIITTALNSYSSRFIAISYHKNDSKKANEYFNSVLFADIFISLIIFIFIIIFSNYIQVFLNTPKALIKDINYLFILVFANLVITVSGTAFQAAGHIKNKLDFVNVFRAISYIIEAVSLISLYTLFTPFVFYIGIGLVASSLCIFFSNIYLTHKYTPELKVDISLFNISVVKELVINGIWNSLNSLGNMLNTGLDLLVCTLLLTPLAMGQLSIAKSIVQIFNGLFQMVSTPFQPLFLKSFASESYDKLEKQLVLSMKMSGFISNMAFSGFVSLGLIYYKLWIPEQDIVLLYWLTVISILSSVLEGAMYPLFYIYTLTVKNKVPCIITIIGGLLNVLGMYLLIKCTNLGIYSVVWTTAIIMLFIEGVTNPIYMSKCLKMKLSVIYKPLILHVISCITLSIIFIELTKIINPTSWISLILCILLYLLLGIIIHFIIVFGPKTIISLCIKEKNKERKN